MQLLCSVSVIFNSIREHLGLKFVGHTRRRPQVSSKCFICFTEDISITIPRISPVIKVIARQSNNMKHAGHSHIWRRHPFLGENPLHGATRSARRHRSRCRRKGGIFPEATKGSGNIRFFMIFPFLLMGFRSSDNRNNTRRGSLHFWISINYQPWGIVGG